MIADRIIILPLSVVCNRKLRCFRWSRIPQSAAVSHSLEVAAGRALYRQNDPQSAETITKLEEYGLDERTDAFESVVEMACLMHDIGNPPFGHFGEAAIQKWFSNLLGEPQTGDEDNCQIAALRLTGSPQSDHLRRQLRRDLCLFEGNARNADGTPSAETESDICPDRRCAEIYPSCHGSWSQCRRSSIISPKPGYYWSENTLIQRLRDELQLGEFCRFPLSYIMEAADDISYCIADLDDAVEKGILTPDTR